MDKKIMIDGVNVAGCEYLYTNKYNDKCCGASIGGDSLCRPSEMICFRYVDQLKLQLQRKEQECEKLEKEIDRYKQALEKIEDIAKKYYNEGITGKAYLSPFENDFCRILTIINGMKGKTISH